MTEGTPSRDNRPTSPERLERMSKALAYRRSGMSYVDIAKAMGCSASTAHKLYSDSCRHVLVEAGAAEEASLIYAREDDMLRVVYPKALAGDYRAIDRVLAINAARARRFGLDATKIDLSTEIRVVTVDQLTAEIAKLEAELAAMPSAVEPDAEE